MRLPRPNLNWLSFGLIASALFVQMIVPSLAQESAVDDGIREDRVEDVVCINEISEDAAALTQDIIDFLGEHYLSEESNSTLIEGATQKFDEYRERMQALVAQFGAAQGYQGFGQEFDERQACTAFVNQQIRSVEQLLVNHSAENASAKQSFTFVTKLKDVNNGLRELNRDFGEYYGAFKTLADKLQNTVQK